MLVYRTGIHKMLVRIANREDPGQTASDHLSRPFWWATSVQNFRTYRKCMHSQIILHPLKVNLTRVCLDPLVKLVLNKVHCSPGTPYCSSTGLVLFYNPH